MNYSYRFNPKSLCNDTKNLPVAKKFNSWSRVCIELAKMKFNQWEAEAILKSDFPQNALDDAEIKRGATATVLTNWLKLWGVGPRSLSSNKLVMKTFGKEYNLELNEEGIPCRRGTMPGNYHPNKTILVPLGTPACCDPTSETYWSM